MFISMSIKDIFVVLFHTLTVVKVWKSKGQFLPKGCSEQPVGPVPV